jgi:hypothetical protein
MHHDHFVHHVIDVIETVRDGDDDDDYYVDNEFMMVIKMVICSYDVLKMMF